MQNDTFTLEQVQEEFKNLETLPLKERYKRSPTVANHAWMAMKNCSNLDELAFYKEVFKKIGNAKLVNRLIQKELELKGVKEIKTIKTSTGAVGIESGVIGLADPTLLPSAQDFPEPPGEISLIAQAKLFAVATGGDGTFDTIIRLVDAPEPLADPQEYEQIESNSSIVTIEVKSGKVKCADLYDLNDPNKPGTELEIPNGLYNVCFYLKDIEDEFFGFIIVLSKTDKVSPNNERFTGLEGLG